MIHKQGRISFLRFLGFNMLFWFPAEPWQGSLGCVFQALPCPPGVYSLQSSLITAGTETEPPISHGPASLLHNPGARGQTQAAPPRVPESVDWCQVLVASTNLSPCALVLSPQPLRQDDSHALAREEVAWTPAHLVHESWV